MRVLIAHVHYRQMGGEDVVFDSESNLLREGGHEIAQLELKSADFDALSLGQRARIVLTYRAHAYGRSLIRAAIRKHQPDVVHFHNLHPLLGTAAVVEADYLGCATVQTLHNYRLSCLAGIHLLATEICERCTPGHFGPGVRRGCYRGSRFESALTAQATTRQWQNLVRAGLPQRSLALTEFMRDRFITHGAPADRIVHKPNSVDAGEPAPAGERRGVLTAGRLSHEKGMVPLAAAWPDDAPELRIVGAGPLQGDVIRLQRHNVRYLGVLRRDDLRREMRRSRVVVLPSVWPEPMSLVALEAFSEATPVVTFDGWSLGSVVRDLSHDCVVPFRDFAALARRAAEMHDAWYWDKVSARCLNLHATAYSHHSNLSALEAVYADAIAERRSR